jgi:hypothetical protein
MFATMNGYPLLSLAAAGILAILTPLIIVVVRHEVRVRRIRLIDEFSQTFSVGDDGRRNPSFEFVKSKYAVDLDQYPPGIDRKKLRSLDLTDEKVDDYISNVRWYDLRSNRRILFASIPYFLLCFFGFCIVLSPLGGDGISTLRKIIAPVVFTSGGLDASFDIDRQFEHFVTIAAVAFVGAYLYTLRLFIRALSVFDLSAITFIRSAAHIVMTFAFVAVIWRAFPDPTSSLDWVLHKVGASDGPSDELVAIPASWFVLALVLGFVPDSGLQFIFTKVTGIVKGFKTSDERFSALTKSTPLDVIDGIDFFTRFRLEEANIFEVQNLAVANPIMLHIETPYGIYQTIDWVAQAQLCTVVGAERFLMFRQHNVRTIFDLERAVLSRASTSQMRRFIASLLLMPTEISRELMRTTKSALYAIGRSPPQKLSPEDFDALVVDLFAQPATTSDPDRTIKHLVRVMADDLHVQRLRQVWTHISEQLGSFALSDSELAPDQPGDVPNNRCSADKGETRVHVTGPNATNKPVTPEGSPATEVAENDEEEGSSNDAEETRDEGDQSEPAESGASETSVGGSKVIPPRRARG